MNVLSLFDGMSCGQIALEGADIKVDNYYASEIDKYAIKVAMKNYPNTIQLGDIKKWKEWNIDFKSIDLILAGFPCQAWSIAGKQQGDNDPRGKLVYDLIDAWKEIKKYNPNVKFLFENVKMKKEFIDYISALFGVKPILINSSLVSAQNRKRLYWTNIPNVTQPKDKGIYLKDILESGIVDRDKSYCIDANYYKGGSLKNYLLKRRRQVVMHQSEKRLMVYDRRVYRKLTVKECERLQTIKDNYTEGVSNTQRYKMLGNGWTVDIISYIFEGLTGRKNVKKDK